MADEKDSAQQSKINIELSEEVAQGDYANLAIITHSTAEFIVDFISMMPNTPKAKVKSRIIMTPQHAKRLLKALNENVRKFESQHGEIPDMDQNPGAVPFPMNFGGPTGEA
ncbi:MAG: DUF3467 domain-containing protein [Salibacteraceae bacterium]